MGNIQHRTSTPSIQRQYLRGSVVKCGCPLPFSAHQIGKRWNKWAVHPICIQRPLLHCMRALVERIHLDIVERTNETIRYTLIIDDLSHCPGRATIVKPKTHSRVRTWWIEPEHFTKYMVNGKSLMTLVGEKIQERTARLSIRNPKAKPKSSNQDAIRVLPH